MFEAEFAVAKCITNLIGAMKLWKKHEAIGKLHNFIRFIFCIFKTQKTIYKFGSSNT